MNGARETAAFFCIVCGKGGDKWSPWGVAKKVQIVVELAEGPAAADRRGWEERSAARCCRIRAASQRRPWLLGSFSRTVQCCDRKQDGREEEHEHYALRSAPNGSQIASAHCEELKLALPPPPVMQASTHLQARDNELWTLGAPKLRESCLRPQPACQSTSALLQKPDSEGWRMHLGEEARA